MARSEHGVAACSGQTDVLRGFADRLASPGMGPVFLMRVRTSAGTWLWVETITNNLLGHPGVEAMVVTLRDVDGQIKTQAALRDSEMRLQAVISNTPVVLP